MYSPNRGATARGHKSQDLDHSSHLSGARHSWSGGTGTRELVKMRLLPQASPSIAARREQVCGRQVTRNPKNPYAAGTRTKLHLDADFYLLRSCGGCNLARSPPPAGGGGGGPPLRSPPAMCKTIAKSVPLRPSTGFGGSLFFFPGLPPPSYLPYC